MAQALEVNVAQRGGRHRADPVQSTSSTVHGSRAFVREDYAEESSRSARRVTRSNTRTHSRFTVVATVGLAGLLGFTTVVPAYADSPETQAITDYASRASATQSVLISHSEDPDLDRSGVDAKKKAIAVVVAAMTETTTTSTDTASSSSSASSSSTTIKDIPADGSVASFIKAALAQLGDSQDCTALVERALRAIGYKVGDLAPMGFGGYGHQVSKSDAQPGDIMMRPGHVSIYLGDGKSINGGMPGYTTAISSGAGVGSPFSYTTIIRLGK